MDSTEILKWIGIGGGGTAIGILLTKGMQVYTQYRGVRRTDEEHARDLEMKERAVEDERVLKGMTIVNARLEKEVEALTNERNQSLARHEAQIIALQTAHLECEKTSSGLKEAVRHQSIMIERMQQEIDELKKDQG